MNFLLHLEQTNVITNQMHVKYISVRYIIFIPNLSILTLKCSITVPSWLLKIPHIFTSRRDSHRELTSAGSKEHLWELCTCLDSVTGRRLNRKSLHMMDVSWSPVLGSKSLAPMRTIKLKSNQRSKLNSASLAKVSEPFFSLPLCEQQSCAFDKNIGW